MRLGIMFFASKDTRAGDDPYRLVFDAARAADRNGLHAVWTPERHFHAFGGIFPNPGIMNAALATATSRIQLRAGSLVLPLHNEIRVAEDWSVVDNLSGGRVAISFGSGWHVDDFVLWPERYEERKEHTYRQIDVVRRLWRGEPVRRTNSRGKTVEITVHPRPVQPELPVWLTSSGDVATFERAGEIGANLLTHLLGQDLDDLGRKVARYRAAYAAGSGTGPGTVTLMLHTYVADSADEAREVTRTPFTDYLVSALSLEQLAAAGGGLISGGRKLSDHRVPERFKRQVVELALDRYYSTASLIGTPDRCRAMLRSARDAGVDEIACLIDFGLPDEAVLKGVEALSSLVGEVV